MILTEKEKKLFEFNGRVLPLPSFRISDGLTRSYELNDDSVQTTYGYIKRMLLEVAEKRNLVISDDVTFDMDELLKEIIKIPNELTDFNVLYYKEYDKLKKYVEDKTKGMSLPDIEEFLIHFNGNNGFGGMNNSIHDFMAKNIYTLIANIDTLSTETDDIELVDDWSQDGLYGGVKEEKVTDEELIELIKYVNSYSLLIKYKENGMKVNDELIELAKKTKLNEFYSNKEFLENLKKIMSHDKKKSRYYFHGTQDLDSASTIISEGLGMMRENLSTTAYPEFSMEQVILYKRGFLGEIGNSAVVIIDEPIEEDGKSKKIVEQMDKDKEIHFCPSGLQGLNGDPQYIVDPKYIVGYVDKENKKIIYNPRYYDYDRFALKPNNRTKNVPFDNERIAEGILSFDSSELETPEDQLQQ